MGSSECINRSAILVTAMILRACDKQLEIATPAKVNLFLELLSRRSDGFHEIETVMAAVSIYDRIRFTQRSDSKIRLSISNATVGNAPSESDPIPTDQTNLICRAIELVRSSASEEGLNSCSAGLDVHLNKTIPSAAGLGGASSNAAAAIVAANRIWKLNWPVSKLSSIAAQLGSDISFFLYGGISVCGGRGEIIQPLATPTKLSLVIAKPTVSLSTARVFGKVELDHDNRSASGLTEGVRRGRPVEIARQMFNRLQKFAEPLTDQIAKLRHEFSRLNALGHQMSGSGSSYFGVFESARTARQASKTLSSRLPNVRFFCSQTLSPHQALPLDLSE